MNVGIDARMLGPAVGGGGLGRYVEQLVKELLRLDQKNRYLLFLKKKEQTSGIKSDNADIRITNTHWYTVKEQWTMPKLIDQESLDLIHFPHWNVPLRLKTPFVVTIHDLILLEEPRSAKATTRHPFVYAAKYQAYHLVLVHALKKSKAIIAVSDYTKSSILKHFPFLSEEKIHVIYEGLTDLSQTLPHTPSKKTHTHNPYFLYVGNAYPHKNLDTLIEAFALFHHRYPEVHLVLAGRDDLFYHRLQKKIQEKKINRETVRFVFNPTDQDLANLYRQASLYLFPSRCEGFGLPPLEAMSFGTPVLASKRSSLPEILGEAAVYFDPEDTINLSHTMEKVFNDPLLQNQLRQKGYEQIKRYSWSKMAEQTLQIYQSCV